MLRTSVFCPPLGFRVDLEDIVRTLDETKADLFVGPEYLIHGGARDFGRNTVVLSPISEEKRWRFIASLCRATRGSGRTVIPGSILWTDEESVYNSAPIVHDGRFFGEVYKASRADSDASYAAAAGQNFATKKGGIDHVVDSRIRIDGVSYRISICLDFLKIKNKDTKLSDIHLVMASGVESPYHTTHTRAEVGGHILYVDNCFGNSTTKEAAQVIEYDRKSHGAACEMLDGKMHDTDSVLFELDTRRRCT